MDIDRAALEEWQKHQPLAILQLDPSDRIVLRVAGKLILNLFSWIVVIDRQSARVQADRALTKRKLPFHIDLYLVAVILDKFVRHCCC